jgi:sec-independent protein translocase protein TatB
VPDISSWEFLTLAVIAVIVFGPDKLPKLAADAGRLIRTVRQYVNGARADLRRELGPEFADVRLSDLTPRGIVKRTLGPDADVFDDLRADLDFRKDVDLRKEVSLTKPTIDLRAPLLRDKPDFVPLGDGERAPYDPDAT